MAICPYCGSQIGDHAEICGFCGGKLAVDLTEAPETVAREIPEADPAVEAAESVTEVLAEEEYEGIPDDILGGMLGSLGLGSVSTNKAPEEPVPAEIPEPPAVEKVIETPAPAEASVPAEAPVPPAAEEAYVAPAVEKIHESPAVEEGNAALTAEQPVYAKPVEKKPAPKWLLPAAIVAVLALIGILFFATRGGGTKGADKDPNLGVYEATLVEMYGMQLDPDDIYEQGFSIELKANGTCEINADGEKGRGNWTLEGDQIAIDDGHSTINGKLSDGTMKLENMLDMGLDMTLEKQE